MRNFTALFLTCFFSLSGAALAEQVTDNADIVVYRSPTCGCCGKWLNHLKDNNFNVKDIVLDDVASVKERYGVPKELVSCHTAIVDGYIIEGHIPAGDIKTLLATKPQIAGITVPGMPSGTPGMEMGERRDPYKVIAFDKENRLQIFNSYGDEN
jgi:hypothetical protein